jgi:hypothetical protein
VPSAGRKRPPVAASARPQPGREGKVQVKAWVEPEFRARLKALAIQLDTPMEALVIAQLEALLRKHGR